MADDHRSTRPSFWAPLKEAFDRGRGEIAQSLSAFPDSIRPVEVAAASQHHSPEMEASDKGSVHGYNRMLDSYADRGMQREEPEQEMER
ncbi:MAG: hypothetical protein K2Y37_02970 [Pirellulales bacterium]|nr:hypothetical protein [Pirellulales bacterium]